MQMYGKGIIMMNNLLVCVFESNENKPCFNPDKPSLFYPFIFLFFFTNQFLFLLQDLKDGFLFRSAWIKTRYVIFNITMSLVLKLNRMKFFVGEEVYFFNDPTIWWPDFPKLFSFKWILHYLDLITELIFNF